MLTNEEQYIQFERTERFKEWEQDKRQRKLAQTLSEGMLNYEPPPDVILSAAERKKLIADMIRSLQEYFGDDCFEFLCRYHLSEETADDLAEAYGVSKRTVYRTARLNDAAAKKFLLDNFDGCLEAVYYTPPGKSSSGIVGPMFQFEYEQKRPYKTYKYKGKRAKTKCMIPEYLGCAFGDTATKCSLCFNDWGGSTCKRKEKN